MSASICSDSIQDLLIRCIVDGRGAPVWELSVFGLVRRVFVRLCNDIDNRYRLQPSVLRIGGVWKRHLSAKGREGTRRKPFMKARESEVVYWAAGFGLVHGRLQQAARSSYVVIVVKTDDIEDRNHFEQFSN